LQATVLQNHEKVNAGNVGLGEAQHKIYKILKLGGSQA